MGYLFFQIKTTICTIDLNTGKFLSQFTVNGRHIDDVKFSISDAETALLTIDATVYQANNYGMLVNLRTGHQLGGNLEMFRGVKELVFSQDEDIIGLSYGGDIQIWKDFPESVDSDRFVVSNNPNAEISFHDSEFAVLIEDSRISVWDIQKHERITDIIETHRGDRGLPAIS